MKQFQKILFFKVRRFDFLMTWIARYLSMALGVFLWDYFFWYIVQHRPDYSILIYYFNMVVLVASLLPSPSYYILHYAHISYFIVSDLVFSWSSFLASLFLLSSARHNGYSIYLVFPLLGWTVMTQYFCSGVLKIHYLFYTAFTNFYFTSYRVSGIYYCFCLCH